MSNLRSDARDYLKEQEVRYTKKPHSKTFTYPYWFVLITNLCHQVDFVEEDWFRANKEIKQLKSQLKDAEMRLQVYEDFRPIRVAPRYEVNRIGTVRNIETGKVRNPYLKKGKHAHVNLTLEEYRSKNFHIGPLVLEAFGSIRPEGMECGHLNGVHADNRIENLKWVTTKENASHKAIHGTLGIGETQPFSKLKESEVIEILELLKTDMMQKDIAKKFNVTRGCIGSIKYGKSWTYITKEFQASQKGGDKL